MREDLLQIAPLRVAFLGGELSVATLIERVVTRIAEWNDPALWITRTSDAELRKRASELDAAAAADPDLIKRLPLFGIPFAVKDNIDVVGMPTTAACPAFAYSPYEAAPVVMHLLSADAVLSLPPVWSAHAHPARQWRPQPVSSALRWAPTRPARDTFRRLLMA